MPLSDRPYMREEPGGFGRGGGMGGMRLALPKPTPAVKALLFINVGAFLLQLFLDQPRSGYRAGLLSTYFGVTLEGFWQLWRYVTFQFLHGGAWHLALNMLGLYFLGTAVERHFGTRRFLWFYLSCGVVAGAAFVIIGALGELPPWLPIIGASGGVYALVLAAAVYFPHFQIIFLFFPVPIRLAALIIFGVMILMVLQSAAGGQVERAMSDVAHLGGAGAAAVWIWVLPRLRAARQQSVRRRNQGRWEAKMRRRAAEQAEIDRILQKIKTDGLTSLSRKERQRLQDATRRQRDEEPW